MHRKLACSVLRWAIGKVPSSDGNSLVAYSTARTVRRRAHENLPLLVRRCVLSLRIPVFNILEPSCTITLAHPKYIKAIRGKKTDKKDAQWIAALFKHDLIAGSFMPHLPIGQLRDLMRYRFKLTNFSSSEKNRLQNCLTVSNIQLPELELAIEGDLARTS